MMQLWDTAGSDDEQLRQLLFVAANQDEQTATTVLRANRAGVNQMLLQLFLSFQYQSSENKELVESEQDPRRLAQLLTRESFLTNEGNEISFYDSISNDSWFNIFSFLATPDFYFYDKNEKHATSLHCVSKCFNTLIINFFVQTSKLKGRQEFLTVRDVSTTLACNKDHELQCMLQFPNGFNHGVTIKKFPEISANIFDTSSNYNALANTPVEFSISQSNELISLQFDDNGIRIVFDESDYRTKGLIASKNSQLQPKLQAQAQAQGKALGFRADEMGNRLTLFHINLESLGHGAETGDDLISCKDKLFGNVNGDFKLIDVNLQNMFNYYIYNRENLKLFDEYDLNLYSIAQMAYYYSKRCWVIGIIDNRKNHGQRSRLDYYLRDFGQVEFLVDISDEIEAVLKDKFELFKKNESVNKRIRMKKYNVFKDDDGRYFIRCYAPSGQLFRNMDKNDDENDDNDDDQGNVCRIIAPFGEKTIETEQRNVFQTEYGKYFDTTPYFAKLRYITVE